MEKQLKMKISETLQKCGFHILLTFFAMEIVKNSKKFRNVTALILSKETTGLCHTSNRARKPEVALEDK